MSNEEPESDVLDDLNPARAAVASSAEGEPELDDEEEIEVDLEMPTLRRSVPPPPPSSRHVALPPPSMRSGVVQPAGRSMPPPPPSLRGLGRGAPPMGKSAPPPRGVTGASPRVKLPLPPPSLRAANALLTGEPVDKAAPLAPAGEPAQPESGIAELAPKAESAPEPTAPANPVPTARGVFDPITDEAPPAYLDLARATSSPDLSDAVAPVAPEVIVAPEAPVAVVSPATEAASPAPEAAEPVAPLEKEREERAPLSRMSVDDIDAAWASVMSLVPAPRADLPPPPLVPPAATAPLPVLALPPLLVPSPVPADLAAPPTLGVALDAPISSASTARSGALELATDAAAGARASFDPPTDTADGPQPPPSMIDASPSPLAEDAPPPPSGDVGSDFLTDGAAGAPSMLAPMSLDDLSRPPLPSLVKIEADDDAPGKVAAFDPADSDFTQPLPKLAIVKLENPPSDVDLTRPLLFAADGSDDDLTTSRDAAIAVIAPAPYASDSDLTRPLPPLDERAPALPSPSMLPRAPVPPRPPGLSSARASVLPPPPKAPPTRTSVPVIVAVPPRKVGNVEHAPSIQIAPMDDSSEFTPTTTLERGHVSSTPPAMRGQGKLSTLPRIPPPARVPSELGGRMASASVLPVTGSVPPPARILTSRWAIALAAITAFAVVLAIGLRPRTGSLVVTVSGATGGPVADVSIQVDGLERCRSAPCEVASLAPGTHFVSVASGNAPGVERAIVLDAGEHAAHHVTLSTTRRTDAGLSVAAIGEGLRVELDGKNLGAPPLTLDHVEAGNHVVRVVGREPYYEAYQESVKLDPGEVRSLGPVRLRVRTGRLELAAGEGAAGAHVRVDGRPVASLPAVLELSPDETHEIVATRRGFADFTHQVVFDGVAERRVDVQLESGVGSAPLAAQAPAANPRPLATGRAPAPARPAASGGAGFLDITSTPKANVVVNGKPLGSTPLRIKVAAGPQTVVFVHPTLGRKIRSASVTPGSRASVAVKF